MARRHARFLPLLAVCTVLSLAEVLAPLPVCCRLPKQLADDLGYGEVSAMRRGFTGLNHNISTPHIDALMDSGIRFTNFYANPECSVSRGSLMTGKHTGHATIRNNGGPYLGAGDTTFLQTLQANGYQAKERAVGLVPTPFLLYIAFSEPHTGFWGGGLFKTAQGCPVPSNGKFGLQATWPTVEQDHAAAIALYHDVFVNKLIGRLTALGLRESTAVIYASDNGAVTEDLIHGNHKGSFFQSSGKLQGWKLWLTEGGTRVPAAVSWPGMVAAGATCDAPQAFWDLAPTILDMAGVPATTWPAGMDGVSLWHKMWKRPKSATTGKVFPVAGFAHPPLYWERCSNGHENRPAWAFPRDGGAFGRAVRVGQWKGLQIFAAGNFSEFRLYNLAKDIGETNDVAAANPTVVAQLKAIMAAPKTRSAAAGGFKYEASDLCTGTYGVPQ